jgi:predicted phage terminase large subunit-like protein
MRLPPTEDLDEQRRVLVAERYRRSFALFFREAWHVHEPATPLLWSWPYQVVCDHLQALIVDWHRRKRSPEHVQRIQNLLCTLPPGCLKSRLLAALVPWVWTFAPEFTAIALSCNPRVAMRDSMIARDIIASPWYQETFQPAWEVRDDADAKGLFKNTASGWRAAIGFDARVIGERGHLLIVDDPHDPEEVESDIQRQHVHDRWELTISNRLNDLGTDIRCGIAQRTHEDDWSARRIAEGWTHLDLPMLFELGRVCETPLGHPDPRTVEGECLHSERFPPDVIAKERAKGERRWATLYQGRPSPKAGNIVAVESLRFFRRDDQPDATNARPSGCTRIPSVILPSDFDNVAIAADLAGGKKTERGDFNAIVAVARKDAALFVLDVWRERADFPEVQRVFRSFCDRYPSAGKYVEKQASGASLVASLEAEIPGLVAVPSTTGKVERLESVLSLFQANNVHFDEHADWMPYAVHEITTVPGSRFDDLTDAIVIALIHLRDPGTRQRWQAISQGLRLVTQRRFAR